MMPLQQIVVSPVVGGRRKSSKEVKDSQMVSGLEPAKVNFPNLNWLLLSCTEILPVFTDED